MPGWPATSTNGSARHRQRSAPERSPPRTRPSSPTRPPDSLRRSPRAEAAGRAVTRRQAQRLDPVQLRRVARRALEAVEQDASVVDAHEDQQLVTRRGRPRAGPTDPARPRRRHHQRPLHGADARRLHPPEGPRRDDRAPTAVGALGTQAVPARPCPRPRPRVHPAARAPADRPAPRQGRRHGRGHPRPRHPPRPAQGGRPRHRRPRLRRRGPPARLPGRTGPRRARRPVPAARPRPLQPALHRGPARRRRHPPHQLRRRRLRRPYAWCELHHRRPWSRDGRTDLADMVPLCGHHHRRLHHGGALPLRT